MSSDHQNTVALITGAGRGLGLALSAKLLSRANVTLIAAVRDVSSLKNEALVQVKKGKGSKLVFVKLDSADAEDAQRAARTLVEEEKIDHLDILIANAGINRSKPSALETDIQSIADSMEVNAYAPLRLFQAFHGLLLKADKGKFAIVSSAAGSMQFITQSPISNLSYSMSKAAVNVVGIRLAAEERNVITLLFHPGLVGTDMVEEFVKQNPEVGAYVKQAAPITPDESATKLLDAIQRATQADSGRFIDSSKAEDLPW